MCRPHWLSLPLLFCLIAAPSCHKVVDEARQAGRDAASFPAADEDYYHDMDGGLTLTPSQVVGRNNWIVWTAGNDHLWDVLTQKSVGILDLLKTISSYPYQDPKLPQFGRHNRWTWFGLVIRLPWLKREQKSAREAKLVCIPAKRPTNSC